MKRQKLKVGLDYDDVLALCCEYYVQLYNEKFNKSKRLEDIKEWDQQDELTEFKMACFNDPEFVSSQPLYPGAKNFIKKLSRCCDVYITSAVPPQVMSARAMQIIENFPQIPRDHIILGASKYLYDLDVILDDGSHNIRAAIAKYPVLMRRPWNSDLSGVLAVNSYNDFLQIIDLIYESYQTPSLTNGGIICLVGPSGSGKTAIMTELTSDANYIKPQTTTTRARRDNEPDDAYRFISEEQFLAERDSGNFLEITMYSKEYYGTSSNEIERILDEEKYAVIPVDICGAISIKRKYRNNTMILFLNRDRESVVREILQRNSSIEEKTRRILSLDDEYSNEVFCDETVENNGTIKAAVRQIKKIVERAGR